MRKVTEAHISRLAFIGLLLILILAFVLRFIALDSQSIWLDEAHSVWVAHMSPVEIVRAVSDDVHPPLYFLVLHYWMLMFGDSEWAVRLLSLILGVAAVAVIYKVGERMFGPATGICCALLLALTRMQIEFSQEARMYSLVVLLALVSVLFFWKLLDGKSSLTFFLYVLSSILLMHAHFYALFVIVAQNIFFLLLLFVKRDVVQPTLKRWLIAQATLFLLFLPWLTVLIEQVMRVRDNFWIARFGLWILWQTLLEYSGTVALTVIFLLLAIYAVVAGLKKRNEERTPSESPPQSERRTASLTERQKIIFLLLWFLTPVLVPYVYSLLSRPIYLPKYTLPGLVAFTVLAARGITRIRPAHRRAFPIFLIVALVLASMPRYWTTPRKANWREAAHYFDGSAVGGDLVLFNQPFSQLPFDYYSKRTDVTKKPFPDYNSRVTPANMREMLEGATRGHERVWLVISLFDKGDLTEQLPGGLGEIYELRQYESTVGVEVFLFVKRT